MKIVKGVLLYTLIIIGILLVIGTLLIGCMFLMPSFNLFGYRLLAKNHVQNKAIEPFNIGANDYYEIVIDANLYNVEVKLRSDDINSLFIQKTDDMFSLINSKEQIKDLPLTITNKDKDGNILKGIDAVNNEYKIIKITAPLIENTIFTMPRKSVITIAVPNNGTKYRITTITNEGDVLVTGTSLEKTMNLVALDVRTVSGDLNVKYLNSSLYQRKTTTISTSKYIDKTSTLFEPIKIQELFSNFKKVTKYSTLENGKTDNTKETVNDASGKEVVLNVSTTTTLSYDYKRVYNLINLNLQTKNGVFSFDGMLGSSSDDIAIVTGKSLESIDAKLSEFPLSEFNDRINEYLKDLPNSVKQTVNLIAEKGTFKFASLYTNKLLVSGKDVMITGGTIMSKESFYFNVPNGFFNIKELYSDMSTIITNNINIVLDKISGSLSVNTTYGNIKIGTVSRNTSLKSVHGNIEVAKAEDSISCESEYGSITVKEYNARAYFKNNHGVTQVTFKVKKDASGNDIKLTNESYLQTCDIITGDGSIIAKGLIFKTNIISDHGGRVIAEFDRMHEVTDKKYQINHSIKMMGGSASVKIPNLAPFKFKGTGTGKINGSVGSATMDKNDKFEVKLTLNDPDDTRIEKISTLLATALNGSTISFSTK